MPSKTKLLPEFREYLAMLGRKGGRKGGAARAKALSAKRRRDIAARAANARWAKRKAQGGFR